MTCRKSYKIDFLNYKAKWDKSTCSENQIWNKPPMSLADKYRFLLFRVWWIKANQILKYDMIWNNFGRYHIAWVHITRYRPIMKSIICVISYNTKESQIRWYKTHRIVLYDIVQNSTISPYTNQYNIVSICSTHVIVSCLAIYYLPMHYLKYCLRVSRDSVRYCTIRYNTISHHS